MVENPGLNPTLLKIARLIGLGLMLLFVVPSIFHPERWHFLNNVNLIFHEAGHMILMIAGEKIMLLGGSFMQVFIPLALAGAFLWRGERYSAGIVTLWAAQSIASVSAYIRDAPTRNMDLITGDPDTHDWWQLLGGWDIVSNHLSWAAPLANSAVALALIVMVLGVLLAVWDDVSE